MLSLPQITFVKSMLSSASYFFRFLKSWGMCFSSSNRTVTHFIDPAVDEEREHDGGDEAHEDQDLDDVGVGAGPRAQPMTTMKSDDEMRPSGGC